LRKVGDASLAVAEHRSLPEQKEDASGPRLSTDQICKVTKSRGRRAAKKENFSAGKEVPVQKFPLQCPQRCQEGSHPPKGDAGACGFAESCSGRLEGTVAGGRALPLSSKENVPRSSPVSWGGEFCRTPARAGEAAGWGMSEKQQKTPVDFATVTIAEFGITQESFTKGSLGKSPMSLKYRRRSVIGVRGSPENNTLIQFLAQQRSIRQREALQEVSPFSCERARSLRDKISAFQTSFKPLQEAEGGTGHPGLDLEAGSSQDTVPLRREQNLPQGSEKLMSDNSGAAWEENSRHNLTDNTKSDTKICTPLSSGQDLCVPEHAAALPEDCINEKQNPAESSGAVLIGATSDTLHDFAADPIPEDLRSALLPGLSRRKVSFVAELSLQRSAERKEPLTPVQRGNPPLQEQGQRGSCLRSVLKRTPGKPLLGSTQKYWNEAADRGGDESLPASSCAEFSEALQTEQTEIQSSEKAKKKRVTFGEVLSPEIFDEALPPNTPLHRGATPGRQRHSPLARPQLTEEPFPQPDFDCEEEHVEPLQELLEDPVAAETLLPVENTKGNPNLFCSSISEQAESTSRATDTQSAEEVENPRKSKIPKQRNPTSAAKKTRKRKHPSYGKRRKRKVNKSLYGERELASRKPLLSPIPEIPEVFSFASSPESPKAFLLGNVLCSFVLPCTSGSFPKDVQQNPVVQKRRRKNIFAAYMDGSCKELGVAGATSDGDMESVLGSEQEFSKIVPDAERGSDPLDCFQQACEREAEEPDSLVENKQSQENLPNKAEQLTRIKPVHQEPTDGPQGAQRTWCPQEDSERGSPARSGAIYFPPVRETAENLLVSFNIEEVLSVPQLQNDSLEASRSKFESSGEKRVRRSMRFCKGAENEGLAWIQIPQEIQEWPPLPPATRRGRRTRSTSILPGAWNVQPPEQQHLPQVSAAGEENPPDPGHPAPGPCRKWRRRSECVSTAPETRRWAQSRRRSITKSGCRKDRRNPTQEEDA
ncbi:CDCA2 protein, partial [Alcedo cyanopectus]|nr:CDCA2 protein [Ceyx cyanopectus]